MPEATFTAETLPPDQYLGPRRYRITAHCDQCDHDFSWITTRLDGKDRPCPRKQCREQLHHAQVMREAANMAAIIASQTPPGHIGDNPRNQAIDKTAEIAMEDYGMTDLKDNVREGEVVAKPLPTKGESGMRLNDAAENFFTGGKALKTAEMSRQAQMLGAHAIAGSFASMAANPGRLMPAPKGKPPLTMVRTEKIA